MALLLSPKSGKLVTVGSEAYTDLVTDPKYRDMMITSSRNEVFEGTVTPSGLPPLNSMKLPPLSPRANNLPSLDSLKLPPLSPSRNGAQSSILPPLPVSPVQNRDNAVYSPPSPSSSLRGVKMPPLPKIEVSPLQSLPPLNVPMRESPASERRNKFASIPSLEETLETTRQPSKREKIERMIEEGRENEGRGIKTRSWAARAPTRGTERHQLHAECGDKCFLLPEQEKFPVCASPRTTNGKSTCEIDCQGAQSALIRARQYKYDDVAEKAEAILQECNRGGLKNFVPSEKRMTSPRMSSSALRGGKMEKSPTRRREYNTLEDYDAYARRRGYANYEEYDRAKRGRKYDEYNSENSHRDRLTRYHEKKGYSNYDRDHKKSEYDEKKGYSNYDRDHKKSEYDEKKDYSNYDRNHKKSEYDEKKGYSNYDRDRHRHHDTKDSYLDHDHHRHRNGERDYENYDSTRGYSNIKLSPSTRRMGKMEKEDYGVARRVARRHVLFNDKRNDDKRSDDKRNDDKREDRRGKQNLEYNKEYTPKGDYETIRLSPSNMNRNKHEDCGCDK